MKFIGKNCPMIGRTCDGEKCAAYHLWSDVYYKTDSEKITTLRAEVEVLKKKAYSDYIIRECVLDTKIIISHHSCKQYDQTFSEEITEEVNIPLVVYGQLPKLEYKGNYVETRHDGERITLCPTTLGWRTKKDG